VINFRDLYHFRHGHASIDEDKLLKTSLYNAIYDSFHLFPEFVRNKIFVDIYVILYGGFKDEAPIGWNTNFKAIKTNITELPVQYTFGYIELIGRILLELKGYQFLHDTYQVNINEALRISGNKYTYLLGYITHTLSTEDQQSIQLAISENPDQGATHLKRALAAFSTSEKDYDLCVRESINAVEYIAKQITGENAIDKALQALAKTNKIHPTLVKSLKSIYDYTSDTARHSTNDCWIISEKDARLVFLSSCAWAIYLTTENTA